MATAAPPAKRRTATAPPAAVVAPAAKKKATRSVKPVELTPAPAPAPVTNVRKSRPRLSDEALALARDQSLAQELAKAQAQVQAHAQALAKAQAHAQALVLANAHAQALAKAQAQALAKAQAQAPAPAPGAPILPELEQIFEEALAIEKEQLAGQDEPLVAACRRFIEGKAKADEPVAVLMADRTIRGLVHRQGLRYRLSETDREDLMQDLAIMFHTKLLPKLRDPEKVWSVLGITARRIAAGKANRAHEVALEDMVRPSFDANGLSVEADRSIARITDLLHEASGQIESPHEDADRQLDRQKAIDKFSALVAAAGASPLKAVYVGDGLPQGEFLSAHDLTLLPVSVKSSAALMSRLRFRGVFPYNGPEPSAETTPKQLIERMPISYAAKLSKIRLDLGLPVKEFAQVLNTSEALMAHFLTGASATPVRIWNDAVLLRDQGSPEQDDLVRRFARKSMPNIVLGWLELLTKRLGREARHADLARATGVHKSTVFRWSLDGHKPVLRHLGEFEEMILGNKPARRMRAARGAARKK